MKEKLLKLNAGVLLALAGSVAAYAANGPNTYEQALQEDAQHYAQVYGISADDGLRRLKLQAAASDMLIAQLREQYKDRLAGIYIEHSPVDRVVVRLKGAAPVERQTLAVEGDALNVDFQPGAAHTQAELETAIAKNLDALKSAFPTLQGTYTDDRTGEVVLHVLDGDSAKLASASRLLGVPARIDALPVPLEPQAVTGGGSLAMGCTTGFVAKQTTGTTRSVTTAAHCGTGNTTFTGVDGSTAALTYQARSWTASNDVQRYTSTTTMEPKFYANSTTTPRTLTGRRTQASTSVGNNICHRGATTGYSCGDVIATNYQPTSYTCGPSSAPVACAATWVALGPPSSGTGLACAGGDSGGPWFISTVAAGIHSAGASSGTAIGQCSLAVYMSTDRISSLGLQLLYGP